MTPGEIIDSVIGDPLYTVSIDTLHNVDYNLCYEIHGENNTILNLVTDECFFINAAYNAVDGAPNRNIIDQIMIRVTDFADQCVDISVYSADGCNSVYMRTGTEGPFQQESKFNQNGVEFEAVDGKIGIRLPCSKYPGNGIGLTIECPDRYLDTATGEEYMDMRLRIQFHRAKLPSSASVFPSGLVGEVIIIAYSFLYSI